MNAISEYSRTSNETLSDDAPLTKNPTIRANKTSMKKIINRYLNQSVSEITIRQITTHKHHNHTKNHHQKDQTCDV